MEYLFITIYVLKASEEALLFATSDSGQLLVKAKGKAKLLFYVRLLLPTTTWPIASVYRSVNYGLRLRQQLRREKEVQEGEDLP